MASMRLFGLLAASAWALSAQSDFYLHDGDRVVFYGDSITDQRLYTTYVETFAVTRYPERRFTFVHSGWGGDRVTGGGGGPIDLRIQRDVIPYQPTVMTIMLGMNDAGYRAFDAALFNTYEKGYVHIVDAVKAAFPNIRITAIEPSPFAAAEIRGWVQCGSPALLRCGEEHRGDQEGGRGRSERPGGGGTEAGA